MNTKYWSLLIIYVYLLISSPIFGMDRFKKEDEQLGNSSKLLHPALIQSYLNSFSGNNYNKELKLSNTDIDDYSKTQEQLVIQGGVFFNGLQKKKISAKDLSNLKLEEAIDYWKKLLLFFYCSSLIEYKEGIGYKIVDFHFKDTSDNTVYNTLISPFISGEEENKYLTYRGKTDSSKTYGSLYSIQLHLNYGGKYLFTPHEYAYLYILYNKEGTIIIRPEDIKRTKDLGDIVNFSYYAYTGVKNYYLRDSFLGNILNIRSNNDIDYRKASIIDGDIRKNFESLYPRYKDTESLKKILTVLTNDSIDSHSKTYKAKLVELIYHKYQEPTELFGNEIFFSTNSIYGLFAHYYSLLSDNKTAQKAQNFANTIKPFIRVHHLIYCFITENNLQSADIRKYVINKINEKQYLFTGPHSEYLNAISTYLIHCTNQSLDTELCDFRIFNSSEQKKLLDSLDITVPQTTEDTQYCHTEDGPAKSEDEDNDNNTNQEKNINNNNCDNINENY